MGKIEIIKIFNKRKKAFVKEYKNLSKDFSEKNIHNLRVAYRRLKSVYNVMEIYGLKADKILRKDVKEIFKILGEMRDYQVNINLLKNLYFISDVPKEIEEKILFEIEKDGIKLRKRIRRNKKEIIQLLKKEEKRIKNILKEHQKKKQQK
jgi:CHAD domain-containing protein